MPDGSTEAVPAADAVLRFPGRSFTGVTKFEGQLEDGTRVYFRQGSHKAKGLQVTIRTREPFGIAVASGKGFLCINSGKCWLIPHSALSAWLGEKLEQQTVDIYLDVDNQTLSTGGLNPMSVAEFVGQF